jgi:histidine triad (HIT) family protein
MTIFHKILAGEIPNYTVYEDEQVLAFLDIAPLSNGHTVVIPKVYAATLLDLPLNVQAGYMAGIQAAMHRIQLVLAPDAFTVGWNVGEAAGQTVPYVHCHIIPRWHGDGGGSFHALVSSADREVSDIATLFI